MVDVEWDFVPVTGDRKQVYHAKGEATGESAGGTVGCYIFALSVLFLPETFQRWRK